MSEQPTEAPPTTSHWTVTLHFSESEARRYARMAAALGCDPIDIVAAAPALSLDLYEKQARGELGRGWLTIAPPPKAKPQEGMPFWTPRPT